MELKRFVGGCAGGYWLVLVLKLNRISLFSKFSKAAKVDSIQSITKAQKMMRTLKKGNCAPAAVGVDAVNLIPEDIMIEILRRLPLESILSFKQVSKKWKKIISNPNFYAKKKTDTVLFLGRRRIFSLSIMNDEGRNPEIPRFAVHRVPIEWPDQEVYLTDSVYQIELLNSGWSNGIVCVKSDDNHFLCHNPFTGSSFTVKDFPMQSHSRPWLCYGFGYDPLAEDYIILVVLAHQKRPPQNSLSINSCQNKEKSLFWVYSFGNKRWKRSNGFPYSPAEYDWSTYFQDSSRACCVNGILHWLVVSKRDLKDVIVTYNLHTGKFGELSSSGPNHGYDPAGSQPDLYCPHILSSGGEMCHTRRLAQLNGQLCYISKTDCNQGDNFYALSYTFKYDLWVMKEYGLGESWEKLVSIDCPKFTDYIPVGAYWCVGEPWHWDCVTPAMLYQGEDGKKLVLFVCNYYSRLFWYGVTEKTFHFVSRDSWFKKEWRADNYER